MSVETGFRVKVVGTYIAQSGVMGKEKIVKNYEFDANIPSMRMALSTVKNKLLEPVLSKKYPDYVSYRTYHIIKIIPLDEKSREQLKKIEIQYMTRDMLLDYISENQLPVDANLYPDLLALRVAVQDAKNDPKAYLKKLDRIRPDLEMDLQVAKLNPGIFDEKEQPASVSVANSASRPAPHVTAPAKKDTSKEAIEKQTENRVEGLRQDMIESGEHGPTEEEILDDI